MNISARVGTIFLKTLTTLIFTASSILAGDTNQWIKPTDGKWEEPFWSLGKLPDSTQSILIDSVSPKLVTIDAATALSQPASLAVGQLVLTGKTTLRLNDLPAGQIFRIIGVNPGDDLSLESESTLINVHSDLVVGNSGSGSLRLHGGRVFQVGGSIKAWNTFIIYDAEFHLTNGVFESEHFTLGVGTMIRPSLFNHFGGTANIGSFTLDGQEYRLSGGVLNVRTNTSVMGTGFVQTSGAHRAGSLSLFPSYNGGGPGSYSLQDGTLSVSNLSIGAFLSGSTFAQNGGIVEITNALSLSGSSRYHPPVQIPATYALTNGSMRANIVELDSRHGMAGFIQAGGSVSISEVLRLNVTEANTRSYVSIDGGVLHAASISSAGAGASIHQTGGELIVTNTFSFGGFIPPPNWASGDRRVPRYEFLGGRLQATGIEIAGEIIIKGSTPHDRIVNLGTFKLAGTLTAGDSYESQLGPFVLATNSIIDLGPGDAHLRFGKSSAESWQPDSVLIITNWSSPLTGRPDDQLAFGTDASGLSPQQLGMIRFVNPAGFPAGEYGARILASGVIVPHTPRVIEVLPSGNKLTLQWDASYSLQTSTNVTGPYEDLPAAKSPYNVDLTESQQRYFRVE
jgi:hypothetical protein